MRTASKRKIRIPNGSSTHDQLEADQHPERAAHERDQQVAREQVGPEPDGQRDQAQEDREDLDREDEQHDRPFDAARHEAFEVADRTPVLYALVDEEDEHPQREHKREGNVRIGRVDLQGRYVRTEDVELLPRVDRQRYVADQVRDEDEDEDRRDQRKVLAFHLRIEVFPRHVAGEVVEPLDRDLQATRALPQAFDHVGHHPDGDAGRQQQIEDPLVDRDRADLEPGVQLELVDRGEDVVDDLGSLVRGDPEQDREQHDPAHPHADDGVEDLSDRAHALFLGGRRSGAGRAR